MDDVRWYHLDGTECVAGWHAEGPDVGRCTEGGGPVSPCPSVTLWLSEDPDAFPILDAVEALAPTLRDRHGRTPEQCWIAGDVFLFGGATIDGESLP